MPLYRCDVVLGERNAKALPLNLQFDQKSYNKFLREIVRDIWTHLLFTEITDFRARNLNFKSSFRFSMAMWPWACYLTFLGLIGKKGIITPML